MPIPYTAETATRQDLLVLDRFEAEAPQLSYAQSRFLNMAWAEILSMPHARFGQHDHSHVFTAPELSAAIGLDADHATHPVIQWYIVRNLANGYGVDSYPAYKLATMAVVHDWGEPWTGDHVHGAEKDEKAEALMREAAVFANFPDPERVLDIIDEMESGKPNGLGRIFRESEWLGYCHTGSQAALRYLQPQRNTPNRFTNAQRIVFGRIATDVLTINETRVAKVVERNRYARISMLGYIGAMKVAVNQFANEFPAEHSVALRSAQLRS